MAKAVSENKKVHIVSLGCPKNRVDSEVMLGHLNNAGYTSAVDPQDADVLVVNTCAFVDEAKQESVNAILELAEMKGASGKKLVVAGCLSQRYAPELAAEIPEVDHFLGTGNFEGISQVLAPSPRPVSPKLPIVGQNPGPFERRVRGHIQPFQHPMQTVNGRAVTIPDPDFTLTAVSPRIATLPPHTTYIKVSEGCSNTCAFCIIPKLRGAQRSRPVADVVHEAEQHILNGAVELNLIAQDLCAYGKDLVPKQSLAQLLRALDQTAARAGRTVWIRCLYAYPRGLTREVIRVLGEAQCIVPYLDMPLQHIADPVLRRMRRGKGGAPTKELVRRLRRDIPELVLRTTFITGLPGETDADFDELMEFVAETRFEHLGVFTYSRERDTPAASMDAQVPGELAEARKDRLMALQRDISGELQAALVGRELDVLVEGVSEETELLLQGRHSGQAPDIDGMTYITEGTARVGDVVRVCVDEAGDYDVAGRIVGSGAPPFQAT